MKVLCEAGLNVCAVNSGPRIVPEDDYRGHRQVYDLKYRGYGDPLRFAGKPHQEPYSVEESEYSEGHDLFEHAELGADAGLIGAATIVWKDRSNDKR